jgi:hypothetical protein
MPFPTVRLVFVLALTLVAAGCTRLMRETFEYEEEITLAIDGSAVVTLSASEPALVALRGIALKTGPHVRPDRAALRAFFDGPGVVLRTPTFSRRYGRRFVHVTLEVADVRQLPRLAPFAWSTYRFAREGDALVFRQAVGAPSGKSGLGNRMARKRAGGVPHAHPEQSALGERHDRRSSAATSWRGCNRCRSASPVYRSTSKYAWSRSQSCATRCCSSSERSPPRRPRSSW